MKLFIMMGKGLVGLFWLGEGLNLFQVFPKEVSGIYHILAVTILAIHWVEAVLASRMWAQSWIEPKYEKMQILAFGVFHILALRGQQRKGLRK
ncbi:DUF1145 domain-containing protein [Hahella sp. SMD15-11]|uniref:DUF1145 domain-containing protein n=1 Tax=Thermohahella caldifontis TaxID=3142973 RepID=A0AB39UZX0_9GAMM